MKCSIKTNICQTLKTYCRYIDFWFGERRYLTGNGSQFHYFRLVLDYLFSVKPAFSCQTKYIHKNALAETFFCLPAGHLLKARSEIVYGCEIWVPAWCLPFMLCFGLSELELTGLWGLFCHVHAGHSLACCFNPSAPALVRQWGPCLCVFVLEKPL